MSSVKMNITKADIVNNIRVSKPVLQKLSEFWVQRIQRVTRSGKSNVTGSKFDSLSEGYIKFRRTYKGAKGELFKPTKSNLTLSGSMIASLKGYTNVANQTIRVEATGTDPTGTSNKKKAGWADELGRPFLGFDKKGSLVASQMIKRDIRRNFKKRRK